MCFRKKTTLVTSRREYTPDLETWGSVVQFKYINAKAGSVIHTGTGKTLNILKAGTSQVGIFIDKAGKHRATIRDRNGQTIASTYYLVNHLPPVLERPFVAGTIQLLNLVTIDLNKQEHGCSGGGTEADKYGVYPRPGEIIQTNITAIMGSLKVFSTYEDNARLVRWIIGAGDPPHFPDDKSVLTPTGLWRPGDPIGSPTPSCGVDAPKRKNAFVVISARNQLGSETIVTLPIVWQQEGAAPQVGPCQSSCSSLR